MGDQKIEIPRGDTRIVTATLKDSIGEKLDLTNADVIYVSVKEEKTDSVYVIKRKEASVEGNPTNGIIAFEIEPPNTEEKNVGNWWYDVQVNFNDGTVYTPIIDNFEILAEITRLTYTITASTGGNGSINPTGAVSVESRADKAFTLTPDSGYTIDTLLIDGADGLAGAVAQNGSWIYTFSTVIADHTIAVTWKVVP